MSLEKSKIDWYRTLLIHHKYDCGCAELCDIHDNVKKEMGDNYEDILKGGKVKVLFDAAEYKSLDREKFENLDMYSDEAFKLVSESIDFESELGISNHDWELSIPRTNGNGTWEYAIKGTCVDPKRLYEHIGEYWGPTMLLSLLVK